MSCSFYNVSTIADGLVMQGARASVVVVMARFLTGTIPSWGQKG